MPIILPEAGSATPSVPPAMRDALANGLNIQGWEFWDSGFTLQQSTFQDLAAQGFRNIRIYWDITQSPGFDGLPTDAAALESTIVLARIDAAIGAAVAAGLKVIINGLPSLDGPDSPDLAQQIAFEALYAKHLVDRFGADNIVLEIANEPAMDSEATWQAVEGQAIAAIRAAVGPQPTILADVNIVADGQWTGVGALQYLQPYVSDPNIAYSYHSYDPVTFTTQAYGPAAFPGNPALAGSAANPYVGWYYSSGQFTVLSVEQQVDWAALQADNRGIVLIEGEFGVQASADEASRLIYMQAQAEALAADRIGWGYWQAYSNDMTIEQLCTDSAGVQHSTPLDPAVLQALGLSAPPATPFTVSFAGMSEADAIAPFDGITLTPAGWTSLDAAALGAAALTPDAYATVDQEGSALSILGSGMDQLGAVGIADSQAHDITVAGFQRAMIRLDNVDGVASNIRMTAGDAYVRTGNGGGSIDVTLCDPSSIGGTAQILAGGGDTTIDVVVNGEPDEAAPANAGGLIGGMYGNDTVNLQAEHGGFGVLLGSGNDTVNILGIGRTDGTPDTLDGGTGFDALSLQGVAADYCFTAGTDQTGNYIDAASPQWGSYRLRNFESIRFAGDGSESSPGALIGLASPQALTLTRTGSLSGATAAGSVVGQLKATDPSPADAGQPLHWFLSDSAGQRFTVNEGTGAVSLRDGASITPGAVYQLGVIAVDAWGDETTGTLSLQADGAAPAMWVTATASVVDGMLQVSGCKQTGGGWTLRWLLDGTYQGVIADNAPDGDWSFTAPLPAAGAHDVTVYLDSTQISSDAVLDVPGAAPVTPPPEPPLTLAANVVDGQLELSGQKHTGSDWTLRWTLDGAYQGTIEDNAPDGAWTYDTTLPAPGQHSVTVYLDSTTTAATTAITVANTTAGSSGFASASTGDADAPTSQTLYTAPGTDILVSGTASDTLFVDCGSPDGWASIENFHQGDLLALLGLDWNVGSAQWVAGSDPQGNSGATLEVDLTGSGHIDAAVTLVGVSLQAAQGMAMTAGDLNGQPFLAVHG